jgi:hypothetical protein
MILNRKQNIHRKFGFFKDQKGIINRYLRENVAWEPHLANTKEFIIGSSKDKGKSKAVVLGSGWLLDIPFKELSQMYEKLIFVDIKHPRQIVHKLRKYHNIKLIETDITGLAIPVYEELRKYLKNKNKPILNAISPLYDDNFKVALQNADFIVSVNLLNQLDILICDYINKTKLYDENEINLFRKYIQSNHLSLLPKSKSTLITDYEELNYDKLNQPVNRKKLLHVTIPDNLKLQRWNWDFDSQRTFHKEYKTVFRVMGVNL